MEVKPVRMTEWIDTNIKYVLVNNLSDHKNYSDFVRGAVAKELRRLLQARKQV